MKKLKLLLFLSLLIIPSLSLAAEPSTETEITQSIYTIKKPSSIDNWYVTKDIQEVGSMIEISLTDEVDYSNEFGSLNISEVDANTEEVAFLFIINNLVIAEKNCSKLDNEKISNFTFEKLHCKTTESDYDIEIIYHLGKVHNKYILILEAYGKNSKDKQNIQKIFNNLSFTQQGIDSSISNFITIENPVTKLRANTNWDFFDIKPNDDLNLLFGLLKNNPFHIFFLNHLPNTKNSYQATNEEYNSSQDKSMMFVDENLKEEITIEPNYSLNNNLKNVIKSIIVSSHKDNKTNLKTYNVSYTIRYDFVKDVTLNYYFVENNPTKANDYIIQFENEIAKNLSIINTPPLIEYEDLNIKLHSTSGIWGSSLKGELISPMTSSAVYLVKDDGKRYVFPNEKVYFSWYNNFDSVKQVPDSDLAKYQIGGNINLKPGTMIKITTVPKVYIIVEGNKIAWVENETAAKRLLGNDWNKKVKDVPDALFTNYEELNFSIK